MDGIVFDIEQLTVTDGPGVRTTVFLKGCPLRCQWCHNPEGLSIQPQLMVSPNGCAHCGACQAVCSHRDGCVACGACVEVCPQNLRRICGRRYTPEQLARELMRDRDYLTALGGGVTFSGGEPTAQSTFLLETIALLDGMHCAVETCGYCSSEVFQAVLRAVDYIMMDVKLVDSEKHRYYTGVDNAPILQNLALLKRGDRPFCIRVPLVPGVNDDWENLERTAELLEGARSLERVELLPYHVTAGAKYPMLGLIYAPSFQTDRIPEQDIEPFAKRGISCRVL